jgi:hypothetical protein
MPLLFRTIRCCGKNDAAITKYTNRRTDLLQNSTTREDGHSIEVIYIRNQTRLEEHATKSSVAQDPNMANIDEYKDFNQDDNDDDMSDLTVGSLRDLDYTASGAGGSIEKRSVASSNDVSASKPTFSWNSSMTCRDEEYSA